jgi:hypothetical protein
MVRIKISALILFIACAVLLSCGKTEDDEKPSAQSRVAGKWYIRSATVTTYRGTTLINTSTYAEYTAADYFELTADGKYFFQLEGQSALVSSSYEINDEATRLSLDEKDEIEVWNIDKLTDTELVLSQEDTYVDGGVTYRSVEVVSHSKKAP